MKTAAQASLNMIAATVLQALLLSTYSFTTLSGAGGQACLGLWDGQPVNAAASQALLRHVIFSSSKV